MAERSTAAIDVADSSGGEPLTAKAEQATADTMARSGEPDAPFESTAGPDRTSEAAGAGSQTPEDAAGGGHHTPRTGHRPPDESADAASDGPPGESPEAAGETGTPARGTDDGSGGSHANAATDAADAAEPSAASAPAPAAGTEADPDRSSGTGTGIGIGPTRTGLDGTAEASLQASASGSAEPEAEDSAQPATDASGGPAGHTRQGSAVTADAAGTGTSDPAAHAPAQPAAAEAPSSRQPEVHSGHKLAGRYRLEECITRLDGFSSWRAVDEKLRRAVGVHVLPAEHPRARAVLAAARSSALLADPRFVQVLDAADDNDLVYVVQEWLPDATELTALLASGPLEVHETYQMVTQVAQAMTAAHREGLAHLRLNPNAVLRTSSGQWRVRGLAVNAALRGIASDTPQRADVEAIGALLYAALTQRWPYESDAFGLRGLPKGVGLIAPDQVRAGVHRGLSELAMRALVNDGATASRQEPPCTTAEDLLKAVSALPRIRPPETAFTPPPEYRGTTYQQGAYRRAPTGGPAVPTPVEPPPPLQSRTGRALKWGVSALLIAALGLGSWQLADALMDRGNKPGDPGASGTHDGGTGHKTVQVGQPLKIADAQEFMPSGIGIKEDEVPLAVDGKTDTAWVTPQYENYAKFGNLPNRQEGSGIIVDLGSVREVAGIDLDLYRSGQQLEVLAAGSGASGPTELSDFSQRLTKLDDAGATLKQTLTKTVRTRYVLVHITSLPPDGSASRFRGGISEIKVLGASGE